MIFNYRCLGCCGCSCRFGSRLLLIPTEQEASFQASKTTSGALLLGRCCGGRSCTGGTWCDFLDEGAFGLLSGGFRNIIRAGDPCDPWLLLLLRCCSCICRRFLGYKSDFFTIIVIVVVCSSCLSTASRTRRGALPRLSRCHLGRHVLEGRRHIVIGI